MHKFENSSKFSSIQKSPKEDKLIAKASGFRSPQPRLRQSSLMQKSSTQKSIR